MVVSRALLLLLAFALPVCADPLNYYDPKLCFILDGFLCVYGLVITGMFLREKFLIPKVKSDDGFSKGSRSADSGRSDAERGAWGARGQDELYTGLTRRSEDSEYRELPRRGEHQRQRKNEQVYQGLSAATRDTYDLLQQR